MSGTRLFFLKAKAQGVVSSALAAFLLSMPMASEGQTTPPAPPSRTATLTVNARLVVLDVVVTDKSGKPVSGLTREDFRVLEDDKPQSIRSFEVPTAHTLPDETLAAGASAVFDPAKPANFGASPVTVLVLDQLNTHFADSSFARRELRAYLDRQPALLAQPATLMTVYDGTFKQLQGFTRDRDALLRALAAAPTKYAWKLEINGRSEHGPIERLDASLRALEQMSQSFAGIRGRKNLIWVGGGFPSLDPTTIDGAEAQEVKTTLQHVTDVLLDTRVTLYAVDPSSKAAGMQEIVSEEEQVFADAAGETLTGGADPFGTEEDFDHLGPATGGRVIRGLNDVSAQIARSVALGSEFYTIGYSPSSDSQASAQFRRIRVVCLRPGLTATTRLGYYTPDTRAAKSSDTAAYDLTTAAEASVPLNALHVTAEQDPASALPEAFVIHVAAPELSWKSQEDGTSVASVYVMAVSLNAKGKMLGHTLHGMTATAKANVNLRDESKRADFSFTAPPVPKTAKLRFIVRDSATGRMGSFDLPAPKR